MSTYGVYDKMRDERRSKIIDVTIRVACKKGIADTGMSDIADAAGISRQTLYKYFSNIDELAYAAIKNIMQSVSLSLLSADGNLRSPLEKITGTLNSFFDYAEKFTLDFLFVSIFDTYYNSRPPIENLSLDYSGFLEKFANKSAFDRILIQGQADGSIRDSLDVDSAYTFLINMVFALAQRVSILKNNGGISQESIHAIRQEFNNVITLYLKA